MNSPPVSIIIVNFNGAAVILDCLDSIFKQLKAADISVVVVDNHSDDGSPDLIATHFPQVNLIRQKRNAGFGTANNIGVSHSVSEYLFLLNSDTQLTHNILPTLIAKLNQDDAIGIVGPQLLNSDSSFQLSVAHEIGLWGEFRTLQQVWQYRQPKQRSHLAQQYQTDQYVDIVVGAAMFMRRSVYEKVGGFDERFFMYFEESDLCQRIRNSGYKILYTPDASLMHLGGYSVAKSASKMAKAYRRSQRYYYQKHRPLWEQQILRQYLLFKRWRQARR